MMDGIASPEAHLAAEGATFRRGGPVNGHAAMPIEDPREEPPARDDDREEDLEAAAIPLPLLWFDDIQPVLDALDFVGGVLTEQGASVVYGESNAGKTFWATDLALHVAAGRRWNGRRVEQGGVIYCALEGGIGFRNRVSAWRQKHCQPGERIPFASVTSAVNLLDPGADTPRLIASIKAAMEHTGMKTKLVVVDTLSRALAGGNENGPDDMGALVRNMDLIRQDTGAHVLFIHHSGKDAAKGARGHSLLRAAIDTEIEVRADEVTASKTATVVKQREMAKGATFGFRLDVVVLGQNRHGEDVTTCIVVEDEAGEEVQPRQKKLPDEKAGWLRDIQAAFAEPGAAELRVPMKGMKATLTLTRKQLREHPDVRVRLGAEAHATLTDAQRTKMNTALNYLRDAGVIGRTEDLVWLA